MRRVAGVHRYELACRLIEAVFGVARPPGADPRLLIERLEAEDPGQADKWLAAADVACEYISECTRQGDAHVPWPARAATSGSTH